MTRNEMEKNISTGVYTITNIVTNQVYIGSTAVSFKKRFRDHLKQLKKNKHCNKKLQNSWNKYKQNNFKFEILEETCKDLTLSQEQYWINSCDPYFNICKTVGHSTLGVKKTKHQRLAQSKRMGGKPFEVWKNGELYKIFELQKECAEELSISQSKISKCLKGTISQTQGFKIKYEGESFAYVKKVRKYVKKRTLKEETKRKISKSNTGKIRTEESKKKQSLTMTNQYRSGEREPNRRKFSEEEKLRFSKRKTKGKVQILNKDGIVLDEFSSMLEMCSKYNLNQPNVHKVLNNKRNTHKGYKFKRIINEC